MENISTSGHPSAAARLEFELLISDLSARFINLPAGQVDREISDAMARVRSFFDVDRSGLYEIIRKDGKALLSHASHADGIPSIPVQVDFTRFFPWTAERLLRHAEIVHLHTRDYPPEAAVDRGSSEAMGIKSTLRIPLRYEGAVRYVIVVSNVKEEKVWPEAYIPRLRLIGEILVNALERKRADEALRRTLEFEMLTSGLSARFVNLPAGRIDQGIEDTLAAVRAFFDVDRCVLLKVFPETGEVQPTHINRGEGVPPIPTKTDYIALYPWSTERTIRRGEVLHQYTRDYPPEASVDRASAEAMGVKSFLTIPFVSEGAVRHLIHISITREGIAWPEEYTSRLRLVGEILVNALERKEADEALRQSLEEVQRLRDRLEEENVYLRKQLRREDGHAHIVGESEAILGMLAQARRVAPTDSTVLILGETGTGKELLAQAIHDMSGRSGKTMVTVNCAALPPLLIESELFGREKGAYTGATTRQVGRIELADGSTLFLDEIGDLPPEIQVKLLRVLQDRRFERLGSGRTLVADVRVIAATNHDLDALVRDGRFRGDLYHRVNVFPIRVPPLRERTSDIPLLVWRFVEEFNRKMGKSVDSISRETMERLMQYPWPGNVRELRNLVERAMIGCDGHTLTIELQTGSPGVAPVPVSLEEAERKHILDALERTRWRIRGKQGAAEILGLRPTTLHSKMKKLGISRPRP